MSGNNFEEILHNIDNVKVKKVEGTLYVMNEKITWMPKAKNLATISHNYVDIKSINCKNKGRNENLNKSFTKFFVLLKKSPKNLHRGQG
jgi:polyisoprenoid-binding protein YceI